ncbi:MAG TPA: putative toxin-antitoxin system toxin component, PIN family [Acidisarcina sp.]|nr:putative toxin-antitoxin system toxin component, PIN family [Acidisarcina sp.]
MRLIVLDSNVLVSARINTQGSPSRIVNLVLYGAIQIVTSPKVSEEYREVTSRAKFHPYGFPPLWLSVLIKNSLVLPDYEVESCSCPDPKDLPFLALAHASGAWLVTGNLRHFPEQGRNAVIVLSPADYLVRFNAATGQRLGGDEALP